MNLMKAIKTRSNNVPVMFGTIELKVKTFYFTLHIILLVRHMFQNCLCLYINRLTAMEMYIQDRNKLPVCISNR